MTSKLYLELILLFAGLFALGTIACLPLYKWHWRRFFRSSLWTKIYWWIPIFAVFLLVLAFGEWLAVCITIFLLLLAALEFYANRGWHDAIAIAYVVLFFVLLSQLVLLTKLPSASVTIGLICICFGSVLSDVLAFFAGSFIGRHPLPGWINPKKAWEGVLGQIVGGLVGVGIVSLLPEIDFSWSLAFAIGFASAAGDLLNSVAKRRLGIKDWGNTIPGHGGVLDRFSSLSFALAVGYLVIR